MWANIKYSSTDWQRNVPRFIDTIISINANWKIEFSLLNSFFPSTASVCINRFRANLKCNIQKTNIECAREIEKNWNAICFWWKRNTHIYQKLNGKRKLSQQRLNTKFYWLWIRLTLNLFEKLFRRREILNRIKIETVTKIACKIQWQQIDLLTLPFICYQINSFFMQNCHFSLLTGTEE